jgi:hypothetical protein
MMEKVILQGLYVEHGLGNTNLHYIDPILHGKLLADFPAYFSHINTKHNSHCPMFFSKTDYRNTEYIVKYKGRLKITASHSSSGADDSMSVKQKTKCTLVRSYLSTGTTLPYLVYLASQQCYAIPS